MLALAALGLLLARTRRLYRRLDRVASAEHELRGAATAIALVCQAWRRSPDEGAPPPVEALEVQLDRLAAGLADLGEARGEHSPAQGADRRGPVALRGRLARAVALDGRASGSARRRRSSCPPTAAGSPRRSAI